MMMMIMMIASQRLMFALRIRGLCRLQLGDSRLPRCGCVAVRFICNSA
jgi:hypothetical protein